MISVEQREALKYLSTILESNNLKSSQLIIDAIMYGSNNIKEIKDLVIKSQESKKFSKSKEYKRLFDKYRKEIDSCKYNDNKSTGVELALLGAVRKDIFITIDILFNKYICESSPELRSLLIEIRDNLFLFVGGKIGKTISCVDSKLQSLKKQ